MAWILGGLLLGGGVAIASHSFGWILLGGGAALLDGRPQPLMFNLFEVARDLGGRLTPAELAADYGVAYLEAQTSNA